MIQSGVGGDREFAKSKALDLSSYVPVVFRFYGILLLGLCAVFARVIIYCFEKKVG